MAVFNRYNCFAEDLANKLHDLFGTTDTLKVLLSNTAPNAATHLTKSDATEISAGFGYTAGGIDIDNDSTRTTNVVTVTAVDKTWTAAGGSIGPARYAILYNDTSAADNLIGWWDYAASFTLADTETFTLDFSSSILTITAT